jgi:hypothetical protein
MHRTLSLLGALLCGLVLTTACSQPLPKLAYPDGRGRIPINPPKANSQMASDVREPSASSPPSGAQP